MKTNPHPTPPVCPHRPSHCSGESGFTFLELIVVTAVISAISVFLLPEWGEFLSSSRRAETQAEMESLADALTSYFEDVSSFPPTLAALQVKPEATTGWKGPYLPYQRTGAAEIQDDSFHDAWKSPYVIENLGPTFLRIRSLGENQTDDSGAGDDLQIDLHTEMVLRAQTEEELEDLNMAVDRFNRTQLPANPLTPGIVTNALSDLADSGYFPNDATTLTRYESDAWGNQYKSSGIPVFEIVTHDPEN